MQSAKRLLIGTIGDEWSVRGGTDTPLTPSSIFPSKDSDRGSERIRPVQIGSSLFYVESHGKIINEFNYSFDADGY